MPRILIAEDEDRIALFLEKGLRANGFTTTLASDGTIALAAARDSDFDLLILDLGLPGIHGFDVLRSLRARGEQLPVVVLTARDAVHDRVAGLESGADDYLVKPFSFEELLARIRVQLRDRASSETTLLCSGAVILDVRTRRVNVDGTSIDLSAREFALTETFLRHPGQVLSRVQLLNHVWGYDYDSTSNIVEVYIGYLRKKLGDGRIQTVRGMGYRFVADSER